jgi:serpin B
MTLYGRGRWVWLLLGLLAFIVGCSRDGTVQVEGGLTNPELTAPLGGGINEFACNLYREVASDAKGNLIFSPFSVHMALGMVYAGAKGTTQEAMADTLCIAPDLDLAAAYGSLTSALPLREVGYQPDEWAAGEPELLVANGIWADHGFQYRPEYVETVGPAYDPELRIADFGNLEAVVRDINTWVSEKTREKIDHIIAPMALPDLYMVLVNAIYFKGAWHEPFHEASTAPAPFHLASGETVEAPTMAGSLVHGRHAQGDGWMAFSMAYEGGNLEMVVILPDGDLADVESELTAAQLAEMLDALEARYLILRLPRFKFEVTLPLEDVLDALGMGIAFVHDEADLSGIFEGKNTSIDLALHKAMIDVNEYGTEAVASTKIAAGASPGEPKPPVEIHVDRPFLFLIRDRGTESILFMGRVMDPR